MLLITFHGDQTGIPNVYCLSDGGATLATLALQGLPSGMTLEELRGLAVYNGNLYVVVASGPSDSVMGFQGPPNQSSQLSYLGTMIGGGQSIMHPFGIVFDASASPAVNCYVSNQDSNVVAQIALTAGSNGLMTGSLGSGCQSSYLSGKYNASQFLDGTFVASQLGKLHKVARDAPDVKESDGGLGVTGTGKPLKPSNSVRGVAIANGILFVCDEVDNQVNMYDLTDGKYLGSGTLAKKSAPTHVVIADGGIWVSADDTLYWSVLPASVSAASLKFHTVALPLPPPNNKIGGLSCDDSGNVYVVFQDGTHTTGTGVIGKYTVTAGTPPTLMAVTTTPGFSTFPDTPEFCLWVSDTWPS